MRKFETVFVEIMAVFVCVTLSQRQNIAGCSSKLTFYSAGVATPRQARMSSCDRVPTCTGPEPLVFLKVFDILMAL
jgi:hypothetical protein